MLDLALLWLAFSVGVVVGCGLTRRFYATERWFFESGGNVYELKPDAKKRPPRPEGRDGRAA